MIRYVWQLLNDIVGFFVQHTGDVKVGKGSRVVWTRIKLPRGARVVIGGGSLVQCKISFDSNGLITIGDRTFIGKSLLVCHSRIEIGDDVMISWGVTIVDHNSHSLEWEKRKDDVSNWIRGIKKWDDVSRAAVVIQNKAWIGFGATIKKGVVIGEGAVVSACAVVTKDVPPFTLVAGNPAVIVLSLPRPVEN